MAGVQTVHHLNCGSFRFGLVTHVVVCETDDGLVMVDAGIGSADIATPAALGKAALALGPALQQNETALVQLQRIGYNANDVRHIVCTHLDYDHISGARDFPDALVHVTATEHAIASARPAITAKLRYRDHHLPLDMRVKTYAGEGEPFLGFSNSYPVAGLNDFTLVPMPGHTVGHAGVAIRAARRGWLFHAGDAFYDRSSIEMGTARASLRSRGLRALETMLAVDPKRIAINHARLKELAHSQHIGVEVFCSHDRAALEELQTRR